MEFQTIKVTKINGKAIVELAREKFLNTINRDTLTELQVAIDQLNNDNNVRVVIITAGGLKGFSVGGDIKEELAMSILEIKQYSIQGHKLMESIEKSSKPYIAAIHGYTIGAGCEIALACDFRIAAENTVISTPEIKLGMISGFGGNVRLPKLIGKTKAKEMLMLGISMNADEAMQTGLINRVVPRSELMDSALSFADKLTDMSSAALALAKKAIDYSMEATTTEAVLNEIALFEEAAKLEDRKEGMRAFLEKRLPNFIGK